MCVWNVLPSPGCTSLKLIYDNSWWSKNFWFFSFFFSSISFHFDFCFVVFNKLFNFWRLTIDLHLLTIWEKKCNLTNARERHWRWMQGEMLNNIINANDDSSLKSRVLNTSSYSLNSSPPSQLYYRVTHFESGSSRQVFSTFYFSECDLNCTFMTLKHRVA